MGERPIIFSSEMVRAILDDRKTQTRRVITQINKCREFITETRQFITAQDLLSNNPKAADAYRVFCPYGASGEKLWVRESFQLINNFRDMLWAGSIPKEFPGPQCRVLYRSDDWFDPEFWRPSIFMPRWASRITLEIVSVRVQRVQDISIEDCLAEGIPDKLPLNNYGTGAIERDYYASLWDNINLKRGYGWDKNCWVWAVEFKRLEK